MLWTGGQGGQMKSQHEQQQQKDPKEKFFIKENLLAVTKESCQQKG